MGNALWMAEEGVLQAKTQELKCPPSAVSSQMDKKKCKMNDTGTPTTYIHLLPPTASLPKKLSNVDVVLLGHQQWTSIAYRIKLHLLTWNSKASFLWS